MRRPGAGRAPRGAITVATRIEIDAPPNEIWPLLVDWERLDRWMLEASDIVVVGPRREGVGVEAEATVRIAGITTRDRIRVTTWEPHATLVIAHLGWVEGTGRLELRPVPNGTELRWEERYDPPWGVLGYLGMLALRPLMRRVFERDLRALKRLAESGG